MTQVILTSGTSWTVPSDCASATVEAIGGGQGGNATNGGNGGDYAKAANLALNPGDAIAVQIGVGGTGVASGAQNAGTDTKFGSAVLAKGGGSASTDVGDVSFAGGAGNASGAGGGAAGPNGAGDAASGTTGGAGDAGAGGAGGDAGTAGEAGAEWGTAGSGGGAGGIGSAPSAPPSIGAKYFGAGTSGSAALPAGCKAGDFVLFVIVGGVAKTFSLANSQPIVPPTGFFEGTSNPVCAIYSYVLTATDVANGSIPVTYAAALAFGVWRASGIDSQSSGLATTGTTGIKPVTETIPGITTNSANTTLVVLAAVETGGSESATWTDPTGFTDCVNSGTDAPGGLLIADRAQATAGATGDVLGTKYDNNNFGSMAAYLIALKA